MQTALILAITALFFTALWLVVRIVEELIGRRLIAKGRDRGKGKRRARKEHRTVRHHSIDEPSGLNITKKQQ